MEDSEPLPESLIKFDLDDWDDSFAAVKSGDSEYLGTVPNRGFSVEFQVLHEIHGDYEKKSKVKNDASLLVIKMIMRPKDREKKVLSCNVKLTVLMNLSNLDDYYEIGDPEIVRYEPGGKGSVNYDEYSVKMTDETSGALNLSIAPPIGGTTIGGSCSQSRSKEYSIRSLHELTAGRDRSQLGMTNANRAWWNVTAANKQDGIGDSLTVAILIKRPPGSSFQLSADTEGKIGGLNLSLGKKKVGQQLGIFPLPPNKITNKCPPGVMVDDLFASATDEVMRALQVGVHVSERTLTLTYLQPAPAAAAAKGSSDAKAAQGNGAAHPAVQDAASTKAHNPVDDYAAMQDAAQSPAPNPAPKQPVQEDVPEPREMTARDSLGTTKRSTQLSGDVELHERRIIRPVAATTPSTSRAERHRRMAALYERLAFLHREEAYECMPPEGSAYADEAELAGLAHY